MWRAPTTQLTIYDCLGKRMRLIAINIETPPPFRICSYKEGVIK